MILDHNGHALIRPCGFNREYERVHEPKADIDVSACGFWIQCDEYAPPEECADLIQGNQRDPILVLVTK